MVTGTHQEANNTSMVWTDRQRERQTDRQTERQTDQQTDRRMDGWMLSNPLSHCFAVDNKQHLNLVLHCADISGFHLVTWNDVTCVTDLSLKILSLQILN